MHPFSDAPKRKKAKVLSVEDAKANANKVVVEATVDVSEYATDGWPFQPLYDELVHDIFQ